MAQIHRVGIIILYILLSFFFGGLDALPTQDGNSTNVTALAGQTPESNATDMGVSNDRTFIEFVTKGRDGLYNKFYRLPRDSFYSVLMLYETRSPFSGIDFTRTKRFRTNMFYVYVPVEKEGVTQYQSYRGLASSWTRWDWYRKQTLGPYVPKYSLNWDAVVDMNFDLLDAWRAVVIDIRVVNLGFRAADHNGVTIKLEAFEHGVDDCPAYPGMIQYNFDLPQWRFRVSLAGEVFICRHPGTNAGPALANGTGLGSNGGTALGNGTDSISYSRIPSGNQTVQTS